MQFKYILYLIFLSLFACEHHSSNINIKNKPEETKSNNQKKEIKVIQKIDKQELVNIVYSNKGFALIYGADTENSLEYKLDNSKYEVCCSKENKDLRVICKKIIISFLIFAFLFNRTNTFIKKSLNSI